MDGLLAACGGFLVAVVWMDLIFDVQVLRHSRGGALPEPVLASIAGYYRRATTESRPMSRPIACSRCTRSVATPCSACRRSAQR